MTELEPMSWEEVDEWDRPTYPSRENVGELELKMRGTVRRAIALARKEKARVEKAEKERDEAISEDANFWEKKAAKAEARLAAAEKLAKAARRFCHDNDLRFCTGEAGELRRTFRAFIAMTKEEAEK